MNYCNRCGIPHENGQCLRDQPHGLRERLVLAAIDALQINDPIIVIGVANDELRISWDEALAGAVCGDVANVVYSEKRESDVSETESSDIGRSDRQDDC